MTQSTSTAQPTLSAGVRKIRRTLRERHGKDMPRFTFTREQTEPEGITQQTPGLFGFWFDGYQHMRVIIAYDANKDVLMLTGQARLLGDLVSVDEELRAATRERLIMDIGDLRKFLETQPRKQHWRITETRWLRFEDEWPEGLKLALMRELGLR